VPDKISVLAKQGVIVYRDVTIQQKECNSVKSIDTYDKPLTIYVIQCGVNCVPHIAVTL